MITEQMGKKRFELTDKKQKILNSIVKRHFNLDVKNIQTISEKGFVNEVYKIVTDNRIFIIRLNDEDGVNVFRKEEWCINQALEKGIPTSACFAVGEEDQYSYMIINYLAGNAGDEIKDDTANIWRSLGKYCRLINKIEVKGFGESLNDPIKGEFSSSIQKYVQYNVGQLGKDDPLLHAQVYKEEQLNDIKNAFESVLNTKLQFGLSHGDLSAKNTIVDGDRVSLIDWGGAEAHLVPYFDIDEIIKSIIYDKTPTLIEFRSFLDGAGISDKELVKMTPILNALSMLITFDKCRWAIDWDKPDKEEYFLRASDAVTRFAEGFCMIK